MDNREIAKDLLIAIIGQIKPQGTKYVDFAEDVAEAYNTILKKLDEAAREKVRQQPGGGTVRVYHPE